MNFEIQAQILNMKNMVRNFEKLCQIAATKDDGKIDPDEAKALKRINAASQRFLKELNKL